ncbi:MAG: hypothetical protein ACXIUB_05470 [Wenzhouxiangella sp.]
MFMNQRLTVWAGLVVATVLLSGCATPSKTISEAGFPLENSQIFILASQNELATEASSTDPMAAGGGLLGVLITSAVDSSRNRRAETAVIELRDSLIDFEIADEFLLRMEQAGLAEQLSTADPVVLREAITADPERAQFIQVSPMVQMNNELSALEIELWIRMMDTRPNGLPRAGPFWQGYKFIHPMPEPESGRSREDYAEAWLALGPEELKTLIATGMEVTIAAAMTHFRDRTPTPALGPRQIVPDYSRRLPYDLHHEVDDWVWLILRGFPSEMIIVHRDFVQPRA